MVEGCLCCHTSVRQQLSSRTEALKPLQPTYSCHALAVRHAPQVIVLPDSRITQTCAPSGFESNVNNKQLLSLQFAVRVHSWSWNNLRMLDCSSSSCLIGECAFVQKHCTNRSCTIASSAATLQVHHVLLISTNHVLLRNLQDAHWLRSEKLRTPHIHHTFHQNVPFARLVLSPSPVYPKTQNRLPRRIDASLRVTPHDDDPPRSALRGPRLARRGDSARAPQAARPARARPAAEPGGRRAARIGRGEEDGDGFWSSIPGSWSLPRMNIFKTPTK